MGTRTYYRDSRGRFHGASGGRATTGRAGGFANSAFRQRVLATRGNARPSGASPGSQRASRGKSLARAAKGLAKRDAGKIVTIGAAAAAAGIAASVVKGGGFGRGNLIVGGHDASGNTSLSRINLSAGGNINTRSLSVPKPTGRRIRLR